MSTPFIEVQAPDAPSQYFDLASERVVVGSAITCQVPVERPEFAREHMLLSPRPEGCYVAIARGAPTAITYNGVPLERGVVPWGQAIAIGPVRFVLHDGRVPRALLLTHAGSLGGAAGLDRLGSPGTAPPKPGVHPAILAASLVIVPAFAWIMFFSDPPPARLQPASAELPALFERVERPCPQSDAPQARALADEEARRAVARAERLPFSARDGVAAVEHHATAAACYRAAGVADAAQAQLAEAQRLGAQLDSDLRNHDFRLKRALEQGRQSDALVEARLIKALVAHRPGSYLSQVTSLERSLVIQLEQQSSSGGGGGAR